MSGRKEGEKEIDVDKIMQSNEKEDNVENDGWGETWESLKRTPKRNTPNKTQTQTQTQTMKSKTQQDYSTTKNTQSIRTFGQSPISSATLKTELFVGPLPIEQRATPIEKINSSFNISKVHQGDEDISFERSSIDTKEFEKSQRIKKVLTQAGYTSHLKETLGMLSSSKQKPGERIESPKKSLSHHIPLSVSLPSSGVMEMAKKKGSNPSILYIFV